MRHVLVALTQALSIFFVIACVLLFPVAVFLDQSWWLYLSGSLLLLWQSLAAHDFLKTK